MKDGYLEGNVSRPLECWQTTMIAPKHATTKTIRKSLAFQWHNMLVFFLQYQSKQKSNNPKIKSCPKSHSVSS